MTRLINADVLKQYIDDCKVCDNCTEKKFMCSVGCTFPDYYSPIWERVLNEQPTVDAIPIEFIQQWISELDDFISRYGGVNKYDSLTEHYIEYTKALNQLMKRWIDHEQN